MASYRCESCGKSFDPNKSEICPGCGAAVPPKVLTRLQRRQGAAGFVQEERENHDPKCHEDDAWTGSYGEQQYHKRGERHAHPAAPNPTRVSNANPARQSGGSSGKRRKSPMYTLFFVVAIISIAIIIFTLLYIFRDIRSSLENAGVWSFFGG